MSLDADSKTEHDPYEWANQQFGEERWGAPGVHRASGGIGPEAGLKFTPEKAGRYDIAMACKNARSITVTAKAADGDLGTGSTDCGSTVTTTMQLPVSEVTIAVEGTEAKGMWALAVSLSDGP
ncbi:hypothetical protein AAIH25_09355 [Arthrobacter crystallopoietes]|uniref:hypothetical protein n=1 Tax=Micrococcaceae TaxID=1268 RepID=UPI0021C79A96|nr:hypothetical protein [Arthrobacter sp. Marseille-P9274]